MTPLSVWQETHPTSRLSGNAPPSRCLPKQRRPVAHKHTTTQNLFESKLKTVSHPLPPRSATRPQVVRSWLRPKLLFLFGLKPVADRTPPAYTTRALHELLNDPPAPWPAPQARFAVVATKEKFLHQPQTLDGVVRCHSKNEKANVKLLVGFGLFLILSSEDSQRNAPERSVARGSADLRLLATLLLDHLLCSLIAGGSTRWGGARSETRFRLISLNAHSQVSSRVESRALSSRGRACTARPTGGDAGER